MNGSKPFYKSKTFWFNALAFVSAVAASYGFTGELAPELQPFVVPAVTLINVVLRFVTKQGVTLRS